MNKVVNKYKTYCIFIYANLSIRLMWMCNSSEGSVKSNSKDILLKSMHISVRFQGKPFNITVIQVYAPTSNAEEAEVGMVLWRPTRPFRTNTQKRCSFHYRGLERKRKSRNTWTNRQIWPWKLEWSRAKANRVLPREHTGHSKHPLPTTQEKTLHVDVTIWSTPKSDWLYSLQPKMDKLYIASKNKTGSWLWLRSWDPYCQIQT